jgi:hypothetical protein
VDIHVLDRTTRGRRWSSSAHLCLDTRHQNIDDGLEAPLSCAADVEITALGHTAQTRNANSAGTAAGMFVLPGVTRTQNLLQTSVYGRALGAIPVRTSLGADWTRCFVFLNRCEGQYRTIESAALLFSPLDRRRFGLARKGNCRETGLRRRQARPACSTTTPPCHQLQGRGSANPCTDRG